MFTVTCEENACKDGYFISGMLAQSRFKQLVFAIARPHFVLDKKHLGHAVAFPARVSRPSAFSTFIVVPDLAVRTCWGPDPEVRS